MFGSNRHLSALSRAPAAPSPSWRHARSLLLLSAVALMALTPGCGGSDDSAIDMQWAPEDEGVTAEAKEAIIIGDVATIGVGAVEGEFSVDAQGAATYSIPIQVPPGINNVEPKLSLSYRSGGGNGTVGVGWALSGLSSVTRCPRTKAQDGVRGGVNGDSNDRFCLDGQRLIAVPGSAYGAHGAEYRTEIESFSRIYSYGWCGAGPCRFEVTDKHGNLAVFGETNAVAKLDDGLTPRAYALQKIKDPNGNYLVANYTLSLGQLYPLEIVYTKHDSAPGLKMRRVGFEYETRQDNEIAYVAGTKVTTNNRMSRIKTYLGTATGEKLVREYRLGYATSGLTRRSLLNTVQECDGLGVCLPATTFTYNSNGAGTSKFNMVHPTGTDLEHYQNRMRYNPGAVLFPADLNGDGRSDLLRLEYSWWAAATAGNLSEYFSRGDGTFAPWEPPGIHFADYMNADQVEVYPFDYNGDGKTDFIRREKADWDNDANLTFGVYVSKFPAGFDVYYPGTQGSWGDFYQGLLGTDGGTVIVPGDYDGDGRGDFIRAERWTWADNEPQIAFNVFFSTGNQGNFNIVTPQGAAYGLNLRADYVDFVPGDYNGDGKTDFIRREKSSWGTDLVYNFGVFYSRGDGYFDAYYPGAGASGDIYQDLLRTRFVGYSYKSDTRYNESKIIPGDFNGDGKTDFIRLQVGYWTGTNPGNNFNLYLSKGKNGEFERIIPAEPAAIPYGEPAYYGGYMDGDTIDIFTFDYNGDGKTDFIRREKGAWENDSENTFDVYISRGDGSFDRIRPGTQNDPYDFYQGGCRAKHANLIPADVDGDGKSDFIRQEWGEVDDDINTFQVFFANGDDAGDFLKNVTNGLGGKTDVTYAPLNDSGTHQRSLESSVTFPNIVAQGPMYVVKSTSVGQVGQTQADTFTYGYDTGIMNTEGRGFLGFAVVWQDGPTGLTQTYYNQAFPLTGTISKKDVFGPTGSNALIQTVNTYVAPSTVPGAYAVEITQEETTHYEGTGSPTPSFKTIKQYTYDVYGNVALTKDLGKNGDGSDDVDTCTVWYNDINSWQLAVPAYTRVGDSCTFASGMCSCTGLKQFVDRYRNGTPNVTHIYEWDDTYGAWVLSEFTYDVHGNVLTKSTPGQAARIVETTTYDADYKTYPTQQTRSAATLSHTTTFQYDARFGALMSQTDPNGNTVGNQFDGLGRLAAVWGKAPDGSFVPVVKYGYGTDSAGAYRSTMSLNSWGTNSWRWESEYLDGQGRVWRSDAQSNDVTKPITVLREYDAFNQLKKESAPFFPGETPKYTTYTRDRLGRMTQMVDVNGTTTNISYAVNTTACSQCVLAETTTEAAGTAFARTTVRYQNVDGRVLRQVDPDYRTIDYTFDKMGRQTSVTDAAGTTTWQYDMMNRVLSVTTPDQGTTTNWYIPATNWIYRTLNTSSWDDVNYALDDFGRVTQKFIPGKQGIIYAYDNPGNANGIGRLTSTAVYQAGASTPSSLVHYTYTADGKIQNQTISIDDKTYVVQSSYDPQGRLTQIVQPNNDVITRGYNTQGLLSAISVNGSNYVSFTGYAATGQPTSITYANGTTTTMTYDAATRLATAKVTKAGSPNLLDYEYVWEPLHNISAVFDLRDWSRTQSFGYSASGQLTYAHSTMYGTLRYGYDAAGNMTSKEGKSYTYTGHRVTSGTGFTATYDAAGNRSTQTSGGNTWGYAYDGERRLKSVTKNGTVVNQFTHDAVGNRVKKVDANGTITHYVSPNYEVVYTTDGRALKTTYVQAPTGRIAAITTQSVAGAGMIPEMPPPDFLKAQMTKDTASGLATYLRNRAMVVALQPWARPMGLAILTLLMALTSLRLARQYRPQQTRRMLEKLGEWLWPSSTAYTRRHPLYALAMPLVLASFLAACGQGPGQTLGGENTASAEEALTAGANGAGIPEVGTVYFHNNHLGSSSLVTDSSGNVKARVEYKPYGEIIALANDGTDMFRSKFTGQEWDKDSELYDYHARSYDPVTGRFLTADTFASGGPQGETIAYNPYAYANNNPVTYTDPSGNFFFLAVVVAAAVGAYSGGMATNGTWNPAQWNWNSWQTYVGIGAGALAGGISGGLGASATTSTMMSRAMIGCALEAVVTNGLRFISPQGSTWQDFGVGVAQDMAMGYAMAKVKPMAKAKATSMWNNFRKSGTQAATEAGREGAGAALEAAGKPSMWKKVGEAAWDISKGAIKAGTKIGGFEARQHISLASITSTLSMPNPRAANRPPPRRTDGSTVADYFRDFNDAVLSSSGADDVLGRVADDWNGRGRLSVARGAKRAPQTYGGFAVLH